LVFYKQHKKIKNPVF